MKLVLCLYALTIANALGLPDDGRNRGYPPSVRRRIDGYPIHRHGQKRNVPTIYFSPTQKYSPSPKKIYNFNVIPSSHVVKGAPPGNPHHVNNEWVPIKPTVPVVMNSYQEQTRKPLSSSSRNKLTDLQRDLNSKTEDSVPQHLLFETKLSQTAKPNIKSIYQNIKYTNFPKNSRDTLPQIVETQPKIYITPRTPQQALIQSARPQTVFENIQNNYQLPPQKIVTGTRVKSLVKNFLPQNLMISQTQEPTVTHPLTFHYQEPQMKNGQHQSTLHFNQMSSNNANKPEIVYNPFQTIDHTFRHFENSQSQNPISPIFGTINRPNDPENERQAFLKNFNIVRFLEEQKALAPSQTQSIPETLKSNTFQNYFHDFKTAKSNYDPDNEKHDYSTLVKDYRDDKLHEPSTEEEDKERDEEEPEVLREENEKIPRVSHDTPQDIPTRPIYPGEGEWAKPGKKHRPYIKQNYYDTTVDSTEEPEGYDTFLKGQEFFNKKREKVQKQLDNFPTNHKLGHFLNDGNSNGKDDDTEREEVRDSPDDEAEVDEEEFVPSKLYAQVRHSEDEVHLPADEAEEGRLREVVKDSKIQTVYTEEGYEDIGYDHEGHEKTAESDEGFEDKERRKQRTEEKRVPERIITKEFNEYGNDGELVTDEEIEADKASLGIPDDADSAESKYDELPVTHVLDSPEQKNKKKKSKVNAMGKKHQNKKDFISTKETKTMTTKDNDEGNMEMQITGEVKVVMQPNNSSKTHQFVKKLPTVHKVMKPEDQEYELARVQEIHPEIKNQTERVNNTNIYIEELIPEKSYEKIASTTYIPPQIDPLEIPVTTLPTTAIPKISEKNNHNQLEKIDNEFSKIKSKVRKKRFTNDFPEINVDTDFISKINHEIDTPKPDLTFVKYPYYRNFKQLGLNENSALRYAEDMRNIPKKEEGKMAFYDQAESRVTCPTIASTVEPIPERVSNAGQDADEAEEDYEEDENQNETDYDGKSPQESQMQEVHEHPKTPRLSGLGDAIDCMKAMYFGENPLDSPFFSEETVGPVLPIFNVINSQNEEQQSETVLKGDISKTIEDEAVPTVSASENKKQLISNVKQKEPVSMTTESNNNLEKSTKFLALSRIASKMTNTLSDIKDDTQSTEVPNLKTTESSLITTPKYKIHLKPKNIYDQIRLLNYLPDDGNDSLNGSIDSPKAEKLVGWGSSLLDSVRIPRKLGDEDTDPEALAMKRRRRIRIKTKSSMYPSFNRNKYIPVTSYPLTDDIMPSTTVTVSSKKSLRSEVFYKNSIKPNEQMNVFTDILNNIKTASENILDNSDFNERNEINSFKPYSKLTSSTTTKPQKFLATGTYGDNSYLHAYQNSDVGTDYHSSVATTQKPMKMTQQMNSYEVTEPPVSAVQSTKSTNNNNKKRLIIYVPSTPKSVPRTQTTTQKPQPDTVPTKRSRLVVKGMFPPKLHNLVHSFKRDNTIFESNQEEDTADKILNKFLVIGMKPPPMQKTYGYNNFINKHPHRKRIYSKRRNKRSTSRASYASLSRIRGPSGETEKITTTTEANDDYVPHRSRNYYYDEKLGKIIYLNQNKKEDGEDESDEQAPVEVYYEEVKEERKQMKSTTPKQNPIFATATPPPPGESYLDFVKKLKSSNNYREIPDPVPTNATQVVTTTVEPVSTNPPEFLSILAKLHGDSNYKKIEDPDDKKLKRKTTTSAPVEEEEEAEEDEEEDVGSYKPGNVRNSPGGDISQIGDNFKIFDINEYIPKIKNYLPKTSVDTSKYKTIDRPTPKPSSVNQNEKLPIYNIETHQMTSNMQNNEEIYTETTLKIIVEEAGSSESNSSAAKSNLERAIEEATSLRSSTTSSSTTSSPTENSTRTQVIRSRGRRPSRTTITTPSPTSSTEPIQRNTRRRITRLRTRPTTTEKYLDEAEDSSTKTLRRRSDKQETNVMLSDVSVEELSQNDGSEKNLYTNKPKNLQRGNYRRIFSEEDLRNLKQDLLTDSEANQFSISEKSLASKDVKVFKKYDPSQKHGGNYRKANGENILASTEKSEDNVPNLTKPPADVEVISKFDNSKKHGGNYKNEEDVDYGTGEQYKETDSSSSQATQVLREELQISPEDTEMDKTSDDNKPLRVSLWNDSVNVKEQSTTEQPHLAPSKPKRFKGSNRKKNYQGSRKITRLSDVVPKPEIFYTDPNLPLAVNFLMDGDSVLTDEAQKFATSRENSDDESSTAVKNLSEVESISDKSLLFIEKNHNKIRSGVDKSNRGTSETLIVDSKDNASTTKKPIIIKDPSKRFYFYAPL